MRSRIRRWSKERIQFGGGMSVIELANSVIDGSGDEQTDDRGVVASLAGKSDAGGKSGRFALKLFEDDVRVEGGKRYGKPWSSTWPQLESRSSRRLDE